MTVPEIIPTNFTHNVTVDNMTLAKVAATAILVSILTAVIVHAITR